MGRRHMDKSTTHVGGAEGRVRRSVGHQLVMSAICVFCIIWGAGCAGPVLEWEFRLDTDIRDEARFIIAEIQLGGCDTGDLYYCQAFELRQDSELLLMGGLSAVLSRQMLGS